MSQVITFVDYVPAPRFDGNPWATARLEEGVAEDGPWTTIETFTLDPLDADPRYPMARSFTTEDASSTMELWYRLVFVDASADEEMPTLPVQNIEGRAGYATVDELAEILRVSASTNWQALRRSIEAASDEIDSELGREDPFNSPPALIRTVCLDRAVEHWQQMKAPFGIIGLGSEAGATFTGHDTWSRHANKLAPYKESWGIA